MFCMYTITETIAVLAEQQKVTVHNTGLNLALVVCRLCQVFATFRPAAPFSKVSTGNSREAEPVSYTHLTLPTKA